MPIKEVVSTQTMIPMLLPANITATTQSAILDTADYDNGVYFAVPCHVYSSGTWTLKIEQSASATFAGSVETTVGASMLINALPVITAVNVVTAIGSVTGIAKVGIHSTERYIRCELTLATTGDADIGIYAIVNPEIAKTPASI